MANINEEINRIVNKTIFEEIFGKDAGIVFNINDNNDTRKITKNLIKIKDKSILENIKFLSKKKPFDLVEYLISEINEESLEEKSCVDIDNSQNYDDDDFITNESANLNISDICRDYLVNFKAINFRQLYISKIIQKNYLSVERGNILELDIFYEFMEIYKNILEELGFSNQEIKNFKAELLFFLIIDNNFVNIDNPSLIKLFFNNYDECSKMAKYNLLFKLSNDKKKFMFEIVLKDYVNYDEIRFNDNFTGKKLIENNLNIIKNYLNRFKIEALNELLQIFSKMLINKSKVDNLRDFDFPLKLLEDERIYNFFNGNFCRIVDIYIIYLFNYDVMLPNHNNNLHILFDKIKTLNNKLYNDIIIRYLSIIKNISISNNQNQYLSIIANVGNNQTKGTSLNINNDLINQQIWFFLEKIKENDDLKQNIIETNLKPLETILNPKEIRPLKTILNQEENIDNNISYYDLLYHELMN